MVNTQIRKIFEIYTTQKQLALLTTLNIQPDKIEVNIIDITFNQKKDNKDKIFIIVGEPDLSTEKLIKNNKELVCA